MKMLRAAGIVAVVCVALTFIAAAWSETFAPLARQDDGFFARPDDGGRYIITYIAPRYARDPRGPRVGDIFDPGQRNWVDHARLNNVAEYKVMKMIVQRGRSAAEVSIALADDKRAVAPQRVATGIEATIAILIFAFLFLRRPTIATAALFYYGCASIDISPVIRQFSVLPDPAFALAAFFLLVAFYELPSFALLLFITRFPMVPTTRNARLRMHAGDAIAAGAALACVALVLSNPSTVGTAHTVLLSLGTVLGLVFAVLAYWDASGESRQRIGWVIIGLVVSDVAYLVYTLVSYYVLGPELQWLEVAMNMATLALPIALAYAVWRHRVLDVAFALNRAAVFTTTSAILVGVFGGLQWAANALVARATHPQNFLIQLAIACVILYVFRVARTSIEGFISHTLFAGRRRRMEGIGAIADEVDALSNADEVAALVEARLAAAGIRATLTFGDPVPSALPLFEEPTRTFELRVRGRVRGMLVITVSPGEGDLAPDEAASLQALASRVLIARDDMLAEALDRDPDRNHVAVAASIP